MSLFCCCELPFVLYGAISEIIKTIVFSKSSPVTQICQQCALCCKDLPEIQLIKCCQNSTHVACATCIKSHFEMFVSTNRGNKKCIYHTFTSEQSDYGNILYGACGGVYDDLILKKVLGEKLFHYLEEQSVCENLRQNILRDNKYQLCPFCKKFGCHIYSLKNIMCQQCNKSWCTDCLEESHDEYENCYYIKNKDEKFICAIIQDKLINIHMRVCPGCTSKYIRTLGCDSIVCTSCELNSCYICEKRIADDTAHSPSTKKCKYYNIYHDKYDINYVRQNSLGRLRIVEILKFLEANKDDSMRKIILLKAAQFNLQSKHFAIFYKN